METRRHFGDAPGALGDHHEVHDHQDGEDNDADNEIAAHDEIAERLNDMAGGVAAFVTARQDQAGRREIERKPQHGGNQQHRGKGGEFQRRLDKQRRHQDQHGEDGDGEREIQKQWGQRQQQDHENGHDADGKPDIAALEKRAEVGEPRERQRPVGALNRSCVGHVA